MSIKDSLSKFWENIQYKLFPQLQEVLGVLSPSHKKLISILELVRIENFVPCSKFKEGRHPQGRIAMARAYIAKIVFKFPHTKQLVEHLLIDSQLRSICGFDTSWGIPSESTFSRAFKEFSLISLPEKVHQALIKETYKDQIVCHVIKDSTPIEAREKHLKKEGKSKERSKKIKTQQKKNKKSGIPNRRQRQLEESDVNKMIQELPILCDKGMKKSSQGYTQIWKGYKLHAAVDDNCIPLAVIITSASLNDCEVAIPLAIKSSQVATNLYDLMDAAYDHPEIKEHSISLGHVPLIDTCPKSRAQKIEKLAEKERKNHLKFKTAEDIRYGERLPKERFNALYKDFHGGRNILYRGYSKISCHVMFGVLALAASAIINLIQ
ncbi:MAG TPA: transposase [Parachlamydiaceae bacterium]|nr:transposase [Parachlamydiaceae bacterium]